MVDRLLVVCYCLHQQPNCPTPTDPIYYLPLTYPIPPYSTIQLQSASLNWSLKKKKTCWLLQIEPVAIAICSLNLTWFTRVQHHRKGLLRKWKKITMQCFVCKSLYPVRVYGPTLPRGSLPSYLIYSTLYHQLGATRHQGLQKISTKQNEFISNYGQE